MSFLEKIILHKKKLNAQKQPFFTSIKERLGSVTYTHYGIFKKAISRPDGINLIAEIKKASPSQGVIRDDFDVLAIARTYEKYQAAAISVLTEDKYFLGHIDYIKKVSGHVNIPVLTKDFIIDEGQIYEARLNGASAVLLIVAILEDEVLKALMACAARLDMDCLVEVHNEAELERACTQGAEIIGINNRNLSTFEVSLDVCQHLIPLIPKGKVIVAESGLRTHQDIQQVKSWGAHAVLIGETFMRADNIGHKIEEVMYDKS